MKKDIDFLVSIVIPCYNSEKTIINTLYSLERQTYKEFEVLIVDDGSTDNTSNLIKKYRNTSKMNIKYIYQENRGVSAARNKAINLARGEYILFLDSDDIYHMDNVNCIIKLIHKYNTDTVCTCYSRNINRLICENENISITECIFLSRKKMLDHVLYRREKFGFSNFVYKLNLLNKYNIRFDERFCYGEDIHFLWKYIIKCENAIFINKETYGYMDNKHSTVNNISWKLTDSILSTLDIERIFKEEKNEFYIKFKNYTYNRVVWSVLKEFSVHNQIDLFYKTIEKFNIKKIKINFKEYGLLVSITGLIFNINPRLFFYFIRLIVDLNIYKFIKK